MQASTVLSLLRPEPFPLDQSIGTCFLEADQANANVLCLAAGAGDEGAGLNGVNLDAFLAFGGVAKLGLGFEAAGLAKHAKEDLAVTDFDGSVVKGALAGFLTAQGVTDFAAGRCPMGAESSGAGSVLNGVNEGDVIVGSDVFRLDVGLVV
jgi:hypothetical protein